MNQLHKAHPGIERMKQLARSYVYWSNIDKEINTFVQNVKNLEKLQLKLYYNHGLFLQNHGKEFILITRVHFMDIIS